jgi:hypothetical protein
MGDAFQFFWKSVSNLCNIICVIYNISEEQGSSENNGDIHTFDTTYNHFYWAG